MNPYNDIPLRSVRNRLLNSLFAQPLEFSILLPAKEPGHFLKIGYNGLSRAPEVIVKKENLTSPTLVDFDTSKDHQLIIKIHKDLTPIKDILEAWALKSDQGNFTLSSFPSPLENISPSISPSKLINLELVDSLSIVPRGVVLSYPIRDLPVIYCPKTTAADKENIFVLGAEEEVEYFLRDEGGGVIQGNEIKGNILSLESTTEIQTFLDTFKGLGSDKFWEIFTEGPVDFTIDELRKAFENKEENIQLSDNFKNKWKRVIQFKTEKDNITKNASFSILAKGTSSGNQTGMEEFLFSTINYLTDINPNVTINFIKLDTPQIPLDSDNTISLDPVSSFGIKISDSESNVFYEIIKIIDDSDSDNLIWENRSTSFIGNSGDLIIPIPKDSIPEVDAIWKIRAFKKINTNTLFEELILSKEFTITVPNNLKLDFKFDSPASNIIAFGTAPNIKIISPLKGMDYELYAVPLSAVFSFESDQADYTSDGTLSTQFTTNLDLDTLVKTEHLVYSFDKGVRDSSSITSMIEEDSMLVIKAINPNNSSDWLSKRLVARVKPNANPTLSTINGRIHLSGVQSHVGYLLRKTGTNNDIGPFIVPGAKGIGWEANSRKFGMQVRFGEKTDTPLPPDFPGDFKIEKFPYNPDPLPALLEIELAVPSDTPGNYEILAIKEYTELMEVLTQKIKVDSSGVNSILP